MERIKGNSREELVSILAKFIKDKSKSMGDVSNRKLPIELHNWVCGMGRDKKWSNSEVEVGNKSYIFTDKEITEVEFIRLLEKALKDSGVKGKVFKEEYNTGWYSTETRFKYIEIYAKPCKEFESLVKLIQKHCGKVIAETEVFGVAVCGKRSSWGDSGRFHYLCYEPNICKAIMDHIKVNKSSRDVLSVDVREYFSHGDDCDYKIAQYQESEWYGCRGNKLVVSITTPKGKVKSENAWYIRGYEE